MKYISALRHHEDLVNQLRDLEKRKGVITLLYAARDENFNQAVVLRQFIIS